jgi:hypothetical protein
VVGIIEGKHFSFLQVKGFGDLTIAVVELRQVRPYLLSSCSLMIAPHLVELANFLAPPCDIDVLPLKEQNVPAVFDIRRKGFLSGASSAFTLRRLLSSVDNEAVLVMPESTYRERFIGGVRTRLTLPKADNIYNAHRKFLEENLAIKQHVSAANKVSANIGQRRVAICPYSRVAAKNIPAQLVGEIANVCIHSGFTPEVLLLEGEKLDQSTQALNLRTIPRSFFSLGSALSEYSCIISADSLPGHLGEYLYIPVFVVKRAANTYWLPLTAFDAQYWGVFDELDQLKSRLKHFLNQVTN